jgi:hypothetical protein
LHSETKNEEDDDEAVKALMPRATQHIIMAAVKVVK